MSLHDRTAGERGVLPVLSWVRSPQPVISLSKKVDLVASKVSGLVESQ